MSRMFIFFYCVLFFLFASLECFGRRFGLVTQSLSSFFFSIAFGVKRVVAPRKLVLLENMVHDMVPRWESKFAKLRSLNTRGTLVHFVERMPWSALLLVFGTAEDAGRQQRVEHTFQLQQQQWQLVPPFVVCVKCNLENVVYSTLLSLISLFFSFSLWKINSRKNMCFSLSLLSPLSLSLMRHTTLTTCDVDLLSLFTLYNSKATI